MNEKQERAKHAVEEVAEIGFCNKEIANLANIDPATVSRLNRPEPEVYVSNETVERLETAVTTAYRARGMAVLSHFPFKVLETCNAPSVIVNSELRKEILVIAVENISQAVSPALPQERFPEGVEGAVLSLGENIMVVVINPQPADEVAKKNTNLIKVKIHEYEHIVQRLQYVIEDLRRLLNEQTTPEYPVSAY